MRFPLSANSSIAHSSHFPILPLIPASAFWLFIFCLTLIIAFLKANFIGLPATGKKKKKSYQTARDLISLVSSTFGESALYFIPCVSTLSFNFSLLLQDPAYNQGQTFDFLSRHWTSYSAVKLLSSALTSLWKMLPIWLPVSWAEHHPRQPLLVSNTQATIWVTAPFSHLLPYLNYFLLPLPQVEQLSHCTFIPLLVFSIILYILVMMGSQIRHLYRSHLK